MNLSPYGASILLIARSCSSGGKRAMTDLTILQPPGWPSPKGYSNGVAGTGRIVMIGGQIGLGRTRNSFLRASSAQVAQALRNVVAVVREAGGGPEHIARLTWYVVDIETVPLVPAPARSRLSRYSWPLVSGHDFGASCRTGGARSTGGGSRLRRFFRASARM